MKREDLLKFAPMPTKAYHALMDAAHSVKEEQIVKKKISIALVLTLVLALIVISAVAAALLSGKEFIEQVLVPKASDSASDHWTQDEIQDILRIAQEHGVLLSADSLQDITGKGGYWKEEVMRLFAKLDLGFYPGTWSLEDQAWYDQLLVDLGLKESRSWLLPQDGEISQEEALAIAHTHITDTYDPSADFTDESVYHRLMLYQLEKENGVSFKQWYIEYMAKDLAHDSYMVRLSSVGRIKDSAIFPGVHVMGDNNTKPEEILERYEQVYGNRFNWPPDVWVAFHQALETAAAVHETEGMLSAILHQTYSLPDSTTLSREEAVLAAQEAVVAKGYDKKEEILPPNEATTAVYMLDGDLPIWKIRVTTANGDYLVELDAQIGQTRKIVRVALCDSSSRFFVSESVYKSSVSATSIASCMPGYGPDASYLVALEKVKNGFAPETWGYAAAPRYFWASMESLRFTASTAEGLVADWIDAYGEDVRFWPLEQRAIVALWAYGASPGNMTIQGIPAETDVQQDQAESIARSTYRAEYEKKYGAPAPESFILSYRFAYNVFSRDDHVWLVEVNDPSRVTDPYCGYVCIDATTGDVLFADAEAP